MKKYFFLFMCIAIVVAACRKAELLKEENYNDVYAGGSQTVFDASVNAFRSAFPNMSEANEEIHEAGDAQFEATFVTAPTPLRGGLGPVYNNVSCASCHIADGRGKPPLPGEQLSSMLFRMSIAGQNPHGGPNPAPGFGGQLQQRAIFGKQPEAQMDIQWTDETHTFGDGTPYTLRRPVYTLQSPYTALPGGVMYSPRVAPAVFGLGLLEAISEEDILSRADENDADADGISGKANYGWDELKQQTALGRFGWKAGQPTLLQQSAGAYNEDMGITSFIFPNESSALQPQHDGLSDDPEVSDSILYAGAFYIKTLAVPARRNYNDAQVIRGKEIFRQAKCNSCHVPMQRTDVNMAFPELSNQVIFPYTDMLLHDMGTGLSDNRPEFKATGPEWRTAPLWGIGLMNVVNGHNNFLHDGRARDLMEAILWHSGEAESTKEYVRNLPQQDRDALIKFLKSL